MNHFYDSVDASDVQQHESLRQSELVSRLTARIQEEVIGLEAAQVYLSKTISHWLLDNDCRITKQ